MNTWYPCIYIYVSSRYIYVRCSDVAFDDDLAFLRDAVKHVFFRRYLDTFYKSFFDWKKRKTLVGLLYRRTLLRKRCFCFERSLDWQMLFKTFFKCNKICAIFRVIKKVQKVRTGNTSYHSTSDCITVYHITLQYTASDVYQEKEISGLNCTLGTYYVVYFIYIARALKTVHSKLKLDVGWWKYYWN